MPKWLFKLLQILSIPLLFLGGFFKLMYWPFAGIFFINGVSITILCMLFQITQLRKLNAYKGRQKSIYASALLLPLSLISLVVIGVDKRVYFLVALILIALNILSLHYIVPKLFSQKRAANNE